jgi:tricarballylate dehydrogenase
MRPMITERWVRDVIATTTGGEPNDPDALVARAGNAAVCSALAESENRARVVLERASFDERWGKKAVTRRRLRFPFRGEMGLLQSLHDLTPYELENIDFDIYSEHDFWADMIRVTEGRADPDFVDVLVTKSFDTLC